MGSERARRVKYVGTAEAQPDARAMVKATGDLALVKRGQLRSVVLRCPDGCGDTLTLNSDPRTGRAWRVYGHGDRVSLYPSVWRTEGCQSHFIVWRGKIDWFDAEFDEQGIHNELVDRVLAFMRGGGERFVSFSRIADELGVDPWDVLAACRLLERRGYLVESKESGEFSRKQD